MGAGGGVKLSWAAVRAELKKNGGPGYGSAEPIISKALGVRAVEDTDASVSAVAFASLFAGGVDFKTTVNALSGGSVDERLIPVVVVPGEGGAEDDGGLALVGTRSCGACSRSGIRT